jgi:Flavoprotein
MIEESWTQHSGASTAQGVHVATILLGVSGSIAAYKAADLASRLSQAGHDVTALLTRAACQLISPNTFLNLTGNQVYTDLWDTQGQTEHIALTDRADLFVFAPATANSLAKLALGLGDDMVSTTLLAVGCPVLVCPAMNTRMWNNPVVQRNLESVRRAGHRVLEPEAGHLACGHVGAGRLADPSRIAEIAEEMLAGVVSGPAQPSLFLEVVSYDKAPSAEAQQAERAYRAEAAVAGTLVASGSLGSPGSQRFGHLHRVADLDAAMAQAKNSPLARVNCRIEVFPWRLDHGAAGSVGG